MSQGIGAERVFRNRNERRQDKVHGGDKTVFKAAGWPQRGEPEGWGE